MKAGKTNKAPDLTEIKGKVVQKKFGKGSKSEHEAIYLESAKGLFTLRKVGANPFQDDSLNKWIGKKVIVTGFIDQYLLMVDSILEDK